MSLKSIISAFVADVEKPFGWLKSHGTQLNSDIQTAQTVLNDGALVATAAGEPVASTI